MQSSVKVVFNEMLSEMKKRFQRNLIVLANISLQDAIVHCLVPSFCYQGDQGQNRRTDHPGRKCHLGGEKRAISLRKSRPSGEIAIQLGGIAIRPVKS